MTEPTPEEVAEKIFNYMRGPWVMEREEFEAMAKRVIAEAISAEREKCAALERALEWYADSYQYGDGNGLSWAHCEAHLIGEDRGERARTALEKVRGNDG